MVPDLNKGIGDFNGKLNLFNTLRLLYRIKTKKLDRIFAIIFAVTPEYQGRGIESGIIKTYKRYGEARVTTVYQLKDFFSLFYLRFIETSSKYTQWRSLQRTPAFYTWAGNSFELLVAEHIPQLCEILRIKDPAESYCWTGKTPDEKNVQIDLLIPAPMERTDYLCEIKFSENTYSISADYEASLRNKLEAFINSKQHKKTHSLQLVMVTSFGLSKSIHNGSVNSTICLDQLFN